MTVTFAEKLARIPHYEPGTSLEDAKERAETADAVKLASNESPLPPHPAVIEEIAAAAGGVNRYPDPEARLLRRRIAERCETDDRSGEPAPTPPSRTRGTRSWPPSAAPTRRP